jgi:hypothetical protein
LLTVAIGDLLLLNGFLVPELAPPCQQGSDVLLRLAAEKQHSACTIGEALIRSSLALFMKVSY